MGRDRHNRRLSHLEGKRKGIIKYITNKFTSPTGPPELGQDARRLPLQPPTAV